MNQTDIVVVGAGPIGIELAVTLKRAGVDYLHFDAKQVGYTVSWFPPQTRFFSSNERIAIAGVPLVTPDQSKASREEYLSYLRGVVQMFDLKLNTYEPIVGIERSDGAFILTSRPAGASPRQTRARRVVLATGDMDHPRCLNIPGEDLPHVSHYFGEPHTYFRKRLLIVGGKNSAVEAALRCHHAGAHVALSYRGQKLPEKSVKYWLLPEINHLIETGRITAHFQTVPVRVTARHVTLEGPPEGSGRREGAVEGSGFRVQGSDALDVDSLNPEPRASPRPVGTGDLNPLDVPADFVLLLTGYVQDPALFRMAGVELRGPGNAPLFNEQTMETNIPGLYVAGTATAGSQQRYTVFIENCHVHVERIMRSLQGAVPPPAPVTLEDPET